MGDKGNVKLLSLIFNLSGTCGLVLGSGVCIMKVPKRIPLQSPIKQLRVEHDKWDGKSWMIWLTANGDFSLGTFIRLHHTGRIERVTLHPNGTETIFEVTDKEML